MFQIELSELASKDIDLCLEWSHDEFGIEAAERYAALIERAFLDIAKDPKSHHARYYPEVDTWCYHLRFSTEELSKTGRTVKKPRHVLFYRFHNKRIRILRMLHERMEIKKNLR